MPQLQPAAFACYREVEPRALSPIPSFWASSRAEIRLSEVQYRGINLDGARARFVRWCTKLRRRKSDRADRHVYGCEYKLGSWPCMERTQGLLGTICK